MQVVGIEMKNAAAGVRRRSVRSSVRRASAFSFRVRIRMSSQDLLESTQQRIPARTTTSTRPTHAEQTILRCIGPFGRAEQIQPPIEPLTQ
jgi:hypothetical protein